jgi:hypothetical protein
MKTKYKSQLKMNLLMGKIFKILIVDNINLIIVFK